LPQAFKQLSHYFHGKRSGKNKTEKKLKKLEEELLLQKASSTDTPLGTLQAMQERQKATGSAFVVLSQGNKAYAFVFVCPARSGMHVTKRRCASSCAMAFSGIAVPPPPPPTAPSPHPAGGTLSRGPAAPQAIPEQREKVACAGGRARPGGRCANRYERLSSPLPVRLRPRS